MRTATHVEVQPPDEYIDKWSISGDLRAPGSGFSDDANYECRDALRERFPKVSFDPETSCFFAYAAERTDAEALAEAIDAWVDERRGPPVVLVPVLGDWVRDQHAHVGRVTAIHDSCPEAGWWIDLQVPEITDEQKSGRWVSILLHGQGSVACPIGTVVVLDELERPAVLDNRWSDKYFREEA